MIIRPSDPRLFAGLLVLAVLAPLSFARPYSLLNPTASDWKALAAKSDVTDLALETGDLGASGRKALARLRGLTSITFERSLSQNFGADDFAVLAKLPNLRRLTFAEFSFVSSDAFAPLRESRSLQELDLNGFDINAEGMQALSEIPTLRRLVVRISFDLNDQALECLSEFPSLEVLELRRCTALTDKALKYIAEASLLRELVLDAWNQRPTCWTCTFPLEFSNEGLATLSKLKHLRKLGLRGVYKLNDRGLDFVLGYREMRVLEISDCENVTDKGIRKLARLKKLEELTLYGLSYTDFKGHAFTSFAPDSLIEVIDMRHATLLDDEGLAAIFSLPNLRVLNFESNTAVEIGGLRHLPKSNSIEVLKLAWGECIGDAELAAIGKTPSLRELSLRLDPSVTKDGIANLSMNPNLQSLVLYGPSVTNAVLGSILQIGGLRRLEVDASNCSVRTALGLRRLKSLTSLRIGLPSDGSGRIAETLAGIASLQKLEITSGADEKIVAVIGNLPDLREAAFYIRRNAAGEVSPLVLKKLKLPPRIESLYLGAVTPETGAFLAGLNARHSDVVIAWRTVAKEVKQSAD